MKKLLLGLGLILGISFSPQVKGHHMQGHQQSCNSVCGWSIVNQPYRFVHIINPTQYWWECKITATNGAKYEYIMVAPGTISRWYRINDYTAQWNWSCVVPQ